MNEITIARSFGILYRTFLSYMSNALASMDFSFSDCIFLINIGEQPGISQDEISRNLAIDKAAITRSVKTMEKKGYLLTKKNVNDKRVKELYLTESGTQAFHDLANLQHVWLEQIFGDLNPEQIDNLADMLNGISDEAKKIKTSLS